MKSNSRRDPTHLGGEILKRPRYRARHARTLSVEHAGVKYQRATETIPTVTSEAESVGHGASRWAVETRPRPPRPTRDETARSDRRHCRTASVKDRRHQPFGRRFA